MKRWNSISVSLFLSMLLLPIISILMIHHISLSEILQEMNAGCFGNSTMYIAAESEEFCVEQLYQAVQNTGANIAVYTDYDMEWQGYDVTIRSMYFSKNYVNLPMISGRFFSKKDFVPESYVAVIGKALQDAVVEENGESCIYINNVKFKVIGILGYEEDTKLDNYIFINGYHQNKIFTYQVFTIDCFGKNAVNCVGDIVDDINENAKAKAEIISGGENFWDSALVSKVMYGRWFIGILLCNIISVLLISVEWVKRNKREYCIRRLVGANHRQIIFLLVKRYCGFIVVAFVFSYLYCHVLYPAYEKFLYIGFAGYLLVAGIFLMAIATKILNEPIEEAIK